MMNGMVGGRELFMPDERGIPRGPGVPPEQVATAPLPPEGDMYDQRNRNLARIRMQLEAIRQEDPEAFNQLLRTLIEPGAEQENMQQQREFRGGGARRGYNPTY